MRTHRGVDVRLAEDGRDEAVNAERDAGCGPNERKERQEFVVDRIVALAEGAALVARGRNLRLCSASSQSSVKQFASSTPSRYSSQRSATLPRMSARDAASAG